MIITTKQINIFLSFCYLIVLDGLGQRLHLHRLVQLVFMQQVNEVIQRALVEAHFRMQRPHTLENVHAAGFQSPAGEIREIIINSQTL